MLGLKKSLLLIPYATVTLERPEGINKKGKGNGHQEKKRKREDHGQDRWQVSWGKEVAEQVPEEPEAKHKSPAVSVSQTGRERTHGHSLFDLGATHVLLPTDWLTKETRARGVITRLRLTAGDSGEGLIVARKVCAPGVGRSLGAHLLRDGDGARLVARGTGGVCPVVGARSTKTALHQYAEGDCHPEQDEDMEGNMGD